MIDGTLKAPFLGLSPLHYHLYDQSLLSHSWGPLIDFLYTIMCSGFPVSVESNAESLLWHSRSSHLHQSNEILSALLAPS
jgi:hypothetical protein